VTRPEINPAGPLHVKFTPKPVPRAKPDPKAVVVTADEVREALAEADPGPNAACKARVAFGGTVVNARPKLRRNGACRFCASGRKFKHCCLVKANAGGPNAGVPFNVVPSIQ
jgi:hypothetical protein